MVSSVKPVKKFVTQHRDDIEPMQRMWEGDYEDSKDTFENNKIHHNIIFKEEKEGCTFLTSINLSGSQTDFEFMLDYCKDHIMLIQEHWIWKDDIYRWKTMAYLKGWQGVWEPAKHTENNADGITGRSGGVAILAWNGILILKSEFEADHRIVGATIGWGRKKSIHISSVYGFDIGHKDNK
eukprot:4868629-Heterocapsa_arctica.AAC.1